MKIIVCLLITITVCNVYNAQDTRFINAMKKNLDRMDTVKNLEGYIDLANAFERIALAEKDKWLPYYYAALSQTLASFTDTVLNKKDSYLDKAVELINIADSLKPNEAENYVLRGMVAQARLQLDPMNRWMKYGQESTANFKKAMEIDSTNPRPEYLMGINTYYTPEQFGGGAIAAKPLLENSLHKFEIFEPENELMPNWGREMVESLLTQISENATEPAEK